MMNARIIGIGELLESLAEESRDSETVLRIRLALEAFEKDFPAPVRNAWFTILADAFGVESLFSEE